MARFAPAGARCSAPPVACLTAAFIFSSISREALQVCAILLQAPLDVMEDSSYCGGVCGETLQSYAQEGAKIFMNSDLLEPIVAENLSRLAFERIEALIMAGEIEPGTKISEAKLARRLGISRGPLREAIGRLEGLGIVTRVTNQGPRVTSLSKEELLELFVVREAIEGMASRHAAMNASEADLRQLGKLLSQHEKDPAVKGGRGYFQGGGDLDFHLQIAKASRNSRLYAFVSGPLFSVLRLYRRRFQHCAGAVPARASRAQGGIRCDQEARPRRRRIGDAAPHPAEPRERPVCSRHGGGWAGYQTRPQENPDSCRNRACRRRPPAREARLMAPREASASCGDDALRRPTYRG